MNLLHGRRSPMARYEYCEGADIRYFVEKHLVNLPASKSERETAKQFWERVEKAGMLFEALADYDEIAAWRSEWRHTRRETKKEFEQRIEREGRQAEAERMRAELVASGLTERETQVKLIEDLQPLDGSETRAWQTPDPWEYGRLFRKKQVQDQMSELLQDEDYNEEVAEAEDRVWWARHRRDERQALANARRRAQALKLEQERLKAEQAAKPKPAANGQPLKVSVSTSGGQDRLLI
jgi:hypothetical protein